MMHERRKPSFKPSAINLPIWCSLMKPKEGELSESVCGLSNIEISGRNFCRLLDAFYSSEILSSTFNLPDSIIRIIRHRDATSQYTTIFQHPPESSYLPKLPFSLPVNLLLTMAQLTSQANEDYDSKLPYIMSKISPKREQKFHLS